MSPVNPNITIPPPTDYFWVPGYEGRYALFYNQKLNRLDQAVFSFVYPGYLGSPTRIWAKNNQHGLTGVYALRPSNGWQPVTWTLAALVRMVQESVAYIRARRQPAAKAKKAVPAAMPAPTLPKNFFWIIGYEGRYALQYLPSSKELIKSVYSFTYPGDVGVPVALSYAYLRGDEPIYYLSKYGSKLSYSFTDLAWYVKQSSAFINSVKQVNTTPAGKSFADAASNAGRNEPNTEGKASWVIGYVRPGAPAELKMVLCQLGVIQRFGSEAEASATAESCAKNGPGNTYTVFKATHQFQTGAVTRSELK